MDELLELSWLIVGVVVFVGIVAFVYRKNASKKYEESGKIPLKRD